jgi:NAD(P)-dependent dehydrogenase (short-subunit alcohol dehydrogenase family)
MMLADAAALITGANQGLGREIARAFLREGARICVCARDPQKLDEAAAELTALAGDAHRILAVRADVSRMEDCQAVTEAMLSRFGRIDVLVNNAGVYGPKGAVEAVDWKDWTDAIQVNVFGSVLMCRAVLPHLKMRKTGKIIQLSGGGATSPLPMLSAYAVSKAAIVRFAETLAEELREYNIDVNAVAPGALNTRLLDEILQAGPERVGKHFFERSLKQKAEGGVPLSIGAELAVFLASSASNGITGKLISAPWDKWQDWPLHLEELNRSDVYTLRRITGRDRGMDWGDK